MILNVNNIDASKFRKSDRAKALFKMIYIITKHNGIAFREREESTAILPCVPVLWGKNEKNKLIHI